MKICQQCGNEFPSWVIVDGKQRNVGSRKYCLECSPFGSHNTKQIHKSGPSAVVVVENTCVVCRRTFRASGNRQMCNSCTVTIKRMRNKVLAVCYLGGECVECGFRGSPSSFAFHHRDSDTKEFALSTKFDRMSWEKLKAELDKCDLLCIRCHGEKHSRYNDPDLMEFVIGDPSYWEKFPWFDRSVFDYLKDVPMGP